MQGSFLQKLNFFKGEWAQDLGKNKNYICSILTFDPAKHAIPEWCTGRKWYIPIVVMRRNRVGGLGWNVEQCKTPWYTHRLMHQKRVTCELHDSYFHLMTIKHAISKIEWAIELLYNSVWTGSQRVEDQMSWRQDVVGKATTQQKGPSGPPIEFWRQVGEKMLEWEHVAERLGPQAPGWAVQENENDTRLCPEGLGRSICCSLCSVSNSLSHTTFEIKWDVYFFKEVFARLYSLSQYVFCMYMCIYVYVLCVCIVNHGHGFTTRIHLTKKKRNLCESDSENEAAHFPRFIVLKWSYLPIPPLGQDMTQGQFLSGV